VTARRRKTRRKILHAVLYVRVSQDRKGAQITVRRQEELCRKHAKALSERLGIEIVILAVYTDNDVSANPRSKKVRKGWRAMNARLATGEIDLVFAYHTDRLYRSVKELLPYIDLCEKHDIETHCVEAGIMDLSNATGRFQAKMGALIAEYEIDRMGERIQAERIEALMAGKWTGGHRPFGYDLQRVLDEDGEQIHSYLVLNEFEAGLIRDGVAAAIAGKSLGEIGRAWAEAGAPGKWYASTVKKILTRPRIAGLQAHYGEVLDGVTAQWPAIVSKEDYEAVCAKLKDSDRTAHHGSTSLRWVGSLLYRCHCGSPMRSGGQMGSGRPVYRCKKGGPKGEQHATIPADWVDIAVHEAMCDLLARYGQRLLEKPDAGPRVAALHRRHNTVGQRLRGLEQRWATGEDETLKERDYWRMRAEHLATLKEIEGKLPADDGGSPLQQVVDAPDSVAAYLALPVGAQRDVVDAVLRISIQKPTRRGRPPKHEPIDRERLVMVSRVAGVALALREEGRPRGRHTAA
jgi:site-specific DNA recombinase